MRLPKWPRYLALGAYACLLHPSIVVAANEISIRDLNAFIKAYRVEIHGFQKAMRDLYYLWDPDRSPLTPTQDTPSIIDPFLLSLRQTLERMSDSYDANPDAARAEFQTYGFPGSRMNSNPDSLNSMNVMPASPTNRAFGALTRILSTATDARTAFSNFLAWAERAVGLRHWYNLPAKQDADWVAPRLFSGRLNQATGIFTFDSNARAANRKRMEEGVGALRGALQALRKLRDSVFKADPKVDGVGADLKSIINEIIDVVNYWGDGVQAARDTYVNIPPLPDEQVFKFNAGDADVGLDDDGDMSISNVPGSQLMIFVSGLGGSEPQAMVESVEPEFSEGYMSGTLQSCSLAQDLNSQAGSLGGRRGCDMF
ncbi:hypothetical protein ABW21_db0202136 [Orbilia brochopaga]|nr:hypothetical protein ABW21_db0202136 [Drechslerella brochopaga]